MNFFLNIVFVLFKDVDRTFKQFVFETMNLTEVTKKNFVQRNDNQNYVIPWDDPYPNIQATLSEEKQIVLKSLNILDAKKGFNLNFLYTPMKSSECKVILINS